MPASIAIPIDTEPSTIRFPLQERLEPPVTQLDHHPLVIRFTPSRPCIASSCRNARARLCRVNRCANRAPRLCKFLFHGGHPEAASGYSSAMKPVVSSPERKRGCCMIALRKSILCPSPLIRKLSSASICKSAASSRVGAQVIKLGDHRVVEPRHLTAVVNTIIDAPPIRHRARPRAAPCPQRFRPRLQPGSGGAYSTSRPVEGRNPR